jgi:hypothetical protein
VLKRTLRLIEVDTLRVHYRDRDFQLCVVELKALADAVTRVAYEFEEAGRRLADAQLAEIQAADRAAEAAGAANAAD